MHKNRRVNLLQVDWHVPVIIQARCAMRGDQINTYLLLLLLLLPFKVHGSYLRTLSHRHELVHVNDGVWLYKMVQVLVVCSLYTVGVWLV